MSGIFISYRRADSLDITGRIHDRLTSHFGRDKVFLDIDTIPAGVDFREHLRQGVQKCEILLAIIGPTWLSCVNPQTGIRRLEEADDYLRAEIEAAFEQQILVVPVLVGWATMPPDKQLPESIQQLAFCNAAEVRSGKDFHGHVDRLISELEKHGGVDHSAISTSQRMNVLPKGLRSFDKHDADFFLSLLPGPRDQDGLPDGIRFWKTRIEEPDPDKTFSVGLIYGPSGCGKSSLIKAGLLPNLSSNVLSVFVEATAEETETRLLTGLRKGCPALSIHPDLTSTLSSLSQGEGVGIDRKVLIVLDQFEQWLHAEKDQENAELLRALRQCDGGRVQCIVIVRDDFWMAATHFMRELELRILEGQNSSAVDLLPMRHAENVLAAFGRAFGELSDSDEGETADQSEFLRLAVAGLAEDGKVICVRLALFAEMLKNKPWTQATLIEVGGMEGVGVTFLEETFTASTAPPEHRFHQKAARAVLQNLLPDAGRNIKGEMKSHGELLAASGYARRPQEFADLIRILDSETRLITPTEFDGSESKVDSAADMEAYQKYYQLTHDYLVPSLREWLTRKQKETRRGRAELRLAERSAAWNAQRENRNLPSLWEFLNISAFTSRRNWSDLQGQVMRTATRYYVTLVVLVISTLSLFGWMAFEATGRLHAHRLTQAIYVATPAEMEKLIKDELPALRRWADPKLKQVAADESAVDAKRLHASLAVLSSDPGQVEYLKRRLLDCTIDEFPVIRNFLFEHREQLVPGLWQTLRDEEADEQARFRAGMALATYATESQDWMAADTDFLTVTLLNSNSDYQRELRSYLKGVATRMVEPIERCYRDTSARETVREAAANSLAEFSSNDPARLALLASEGTPAQHRILYTKLAQCPSVNETVRDTLLSLIQEQPHDGLDELQRIQLGRRRAGAAITLLRMGERESFNIIFQSREDPESFTQFVHRCKELGCTASELLECLDLATEENVRFGLLLALGEYSLSDIPQSRRESLIELLAHWYSGDPSSSIHSACGWLLRNWNETALAEKVDRTEIPYDQSGTRQWYVQKIGGQFFTFIVFQPAEFRMGSPESEEYRQSDEQTHTVRFTHPIAVCDREVTWQQFNDFDEGKLFRIALEQKEWIKEDQVANFMSWYQAVAYCRWLTAQAGLTEHDQCYDDPKSLEKDAEGNPMNWPFNPQQPGFRLLTEAEWEFVCRSGTTTTYGFGSDRTLLDRYAWYADNSGQRAHAAAELRPNFRGLFDMHGNVVEWCHDWYVKSLIDEVDPSGPENGEMRLLHGGGWNVGTRYCRSADRTYDPPLDRDTYDGFRFCVRCGNEHASQEP